MAVKADVPLPERCQCKLFYDFKLYNGAPLMSGPPIWSEDEAQKVCAKVGLANGAFLQRHYFQIQKTCTEFGSQHSEMDEVNIKEQLELANQFVLLLRHNLAQAVNVEDSKDI
ncbi:hypothetical protein BGZ99_001832 [Dissophora globulifera]|uniref:Uncharacterized protein n=1 Tax=Dissophora globulifera TaxID=979702 RepID=A0A9P6UIQ0_9FUNG|nr:hypothetical protein BGZ99_001832 [Dissophora globulifera]